MDTQDTDDLIIDESNFDLYFFDVRKHGPKAGHVMARYISWASFGDGPEKRNLIAVLKKGKAESAAEIMKKLHYAREPDCYRICAEICEDLASGMSEEEVCKKQYEYVIEAFYYTKREYIPKNDPHWSTLDFIKYDKDTKSYKMTIDL